MCSVAVIDWVAELAASERQLELAEPLRIANISKVDRAFGALEGDPGDTENSSEGSEDSYTSSLEDENSPKQPSSQISEIATMLVERPPATNQSISPPEDAVARSLCSYSEKLESIIKKSPPSPHSAPFQSAADASDRLIAFERRVQNLQREDLQRARGEHGASRTRRKPLDPAPRPGSNSKPKTAPGSGPLVD